MREGGKRGREGRDGGREESHYKGPERQGETIGGREERRKRGGRETKHNNSAKLSLLLTLLLLLFE